jgi:hypothetical protein
MIWKRRGLREKRQRAKDIQDVQSGKWEKKQERAVEVRREEIRNAKGHKESEWHLSTQRTQLA